MGLSQRKREINQRRHRRKKLEKLKKKHLTGTVSDKKEIEDKMRLLTPGAEVLISRLSTQED